MFSVCLGFYSLTVAFESHGSCMQPQSKEGGKGFPTFPAHLRMRPVSRGNSRRSVVGGVTCRNTPISRPTLEKNPMPRHLFEGNPVDEGTKRRVTDTPVHHSVKAAGSTHSSTTGLSSHEQLERQAEFHSSTQDEA